MKKQKSVTLYNMILPIWLLVLFPQVWIVVLPANFLIDLLVLRLSFRHQGIENSKQKAKECIFRVWVAGFAGDFAGGIGMASMMFFDFDLQTPFGKWWFDNLTNSVMYNPFETIWAFLWVTVCVVIAGVALYWLNRKWTLQNSGLTEAQKKSTALAMAVFTAPYLFYLPTAWFF